MKSGRRDFFPNDGWLFVEIEGDGRQFLDADERGELRIGKVIDGAPRTVKLGQIALHQRVIFPESKLVDFAYGGKKVTALRRDDIIALLEML
jgi:hypothetical protein